MAPKSRYVTIPIFLPELACPFQCIYCDQSKISQQYSLPTDDEIIQTIEQHLKSLPKNTIRVQVAFFGGTFTGLSEAKQRHYLSLVQPFIQSGAVHGIRLSSRPDYIDDAILLLLKNNGVTHIELGAQSLVDEVLVESQRGHTFQQVAEASKLIKQGGFELGLQMMIGLPGDTLPFSLLTAQRIVELGASETRIYPTLVVKDTELHHLFLEGKYQPLSDEQSVEWAAKIFLFFENNNLKVLRLGLFPDEDFLNHEVAAGPSMVHFKERVLTYIWSQIFEKACRDFSIDSKSKMRILVPKDQLNFAIGFKAANLHQLQNRFAKLKIIASEQLSKFDYEVHYR